MVNISAAMWANADTEPARVAVRSASGELSYGQLKALAGRVAGAAAAAGLRPLDRVVVIAPTVIEFPIVYYGLQAAGVSVVAMNPMATAAEIGYVLDDAEACLVVAWHAHAESASTAAAQRGIALWTIVPGAEFDAEPAEFVHDSAPDDTAVILYTSGTTGRPKGVELTTANLLATVKAFEQVLALTSQDRVATALPLFHVFGQANIMNTTLTVGASLSLQAPFEPTAILRMIRRDEITTLAAVPTMWNAVLRASDNCVPGDFEHLRLGISGGATLPAAVTGAFKERFNCTILEGYGLTESTAAATFNAYNSPHKSGTVGPPVPGCEIELRNASGALMPHGQVGEIYLRSATVMKGYRNRAEATAEVLDSGWLKTGDLGKVDEDGYLTVVGRLTDVIIRGGYNVYPREVEEVFYQHPDVVEVAVVGVPDDFYGEEVAAVIVLRPGADLDVAALRRWAKVRLSAYKVPRLYHRVETLPKGGSGKVTKHKIDVSAIRAETTDVGR